MTAFGLLRPEWDFQIGAVRSDIYIPCATSAVTSDRVFNAAENFPVPENGGHHLHRIL